MLFSIFIDHQKLFMSENKNIHKEDSVERIILDEILKNGTCGYCLYFQKKNIIELNLFTQLMLGLEDLDKEIDIDIFKSFLFNKDDQKKFEDGIAQLIQEKQDFTIDFKTLVRNNDINASRYFSLKFSEISKDLYLGLFLDKTGQKKAEKEMRRYRSRISREENFKSAFLKNLSYEIRTPMNAILGFSELLSLPDVSPEQVRNFTSVIRDKGNYLISFMDDVIELSKFESDNIQFNKSTFELAPLLKELYIEFENRRIERGKENILLQLNIPKEIEDSVIYTDPGRLQQILGNLLSNALKYTEKGTVEFGFHKSTNNYKFYVSDTGIGLSEENQKKIFNRFEVVEETSVKRLGGTGLSLTIAKRIAENLGGKIKVSSKPGEGSRFQLNIPIKSVGKIMKKGNSEEEDNNTDIFSNLNWKDKVLLVAEDEEVNYRFLEAVLLRTGAKILRARNGKEAVELFRKIARIDLILMDLKMPVLDGFEAIRIIKKEKKDLPIIAQTAFAEMSEIKKCKTSGCDDYITKPIDISLLTAKIENLF